MSTPDLPTGTVTFLFTDIEGSTRLLEALGPAYRNVQDRHHAILRAAIGEGGGHEVSTAGDSFFAVFSTPTGAIHAAVQAQRALAGDGGSDGTATRVRMGVHSGDGVLAGDTYLGLDVNRAARIAAAAHGGQILVSGATREMVERALTPGLAFLDLGVHRLKDITQPEHLHQLVGDGLDERFPPLRTIDAPAYDLPAEVTRLIGRDRERAQVRELLAAHRLVTLTGPGGTGKTRIALRVAAEAGDDFRDGVVFVDLSSIGDAALVAEAIASALRVRLEPGQDAVVALGDRLRDRVLLLILDNVEQVLAAGPAVIDPILRSTSRLVILATSRVPLQLRGEQRYPIPPLSLVRAEPGSDVEGLLSVEAIALFVDRASGVDPSFRLTPENATAVAAIAARLDGLPLALELAAARLRFMSPEQLLQRLDRRLPLLTTDDAGVPDRQRTLRRTIEWSHDLLGEPERRLFARLAMFVGGADLEAIEVVANPADELGLSTLDGLGSLLDKNLVRTLDATGDRRIGMLETIREFGHERLGASGDEPLLRRRAIEHWIELASGLGSMPPADQRRRQRRLEADHDNLRASLAWALRSQEAELGLRLGAALLDFWRLGSHFQEAVGWLDALLAMPAGALLTGLRARAMTASAALSSWVLETDDYLRRAAEAVHLNREAGDAAGIAEAVGELGVALLFAGQAGPAQANIEEAVGRFDALGERHKAAEFRTAHGIVAMASRDTQLARRRIEAPLETFRELGDHYWVAFTQRLLGGIDRFEGDLEAAARRFRDSLELAVESGVTVMIASALYAFADLAVARDQPERALRLVGATEVIREEVGQATALEAEMVGDVGAVARSALDPATADDLLLEGRAMGIGAAVAYALERPRPAAGLQVTG